MPTLERASYLSGLYEELNDQCHRYVTLLDEWHRLQGRIEVAERALRTTRDHLWDTLSEVSDDPFNDPDMPKDWISTLYHVRFIGMRAADAIMEVLKEHEQPVTTDELLECLNRGNFRFRTTTPLREIHAAMMRQSHVRRDGDTWIYEPPTRKR